MAKMADGMPVSERTYVAGDRVVVRYLDRPARTGTVEGTGHNYVTGTPNPDILRIRMDEPESKWAGPVEQFHRDWVYRDKLAVAGDRTEQSP